jgi:hypothetical protein
MRKAWVVVLAVIFIAGAAIVARRGGRLRTNSSAQGGNSQSDSQRTASDSKTTVAVSSAGSSAAIEISKHGPGMRRQPPESLKLPVPRTFDLKHVDPANFAAALGNDPDRIFNYLRDEIAYEVYTGSLRGPRGTLLAMSGNSVDRASLLASMLQHAGQRVRFAQGTLPEPQARELVSSMWAERSDPALAHVDVKPSQSLTKDLDVLFNGVKRDYTLIRDHLKEVNLKITPEPAPSLDSLVKETQNHYWIQWFKNGTWLDLDPSFADSSPGEEYATAERTFDVLSDDLFHQVEIRIRIEEYTGDQVSSRVILTRRVKAADLSAVDVLLSHQPENWQGPATSLPGAITSAIQNTGRVKPVLLSAEKDWTAGEPYYPKQPAKGGMGGVFNALSGRGTRHDVPIATAESIELDFIAPGGSKRTAVREIFDLVGKARRVKHSNLSAEEVSTATGENATDVINNIYGLFFTTGRIVAGHLSNVVRDEKQVEETAPDIDGFLRRVNITFAVTSDALLGRLGHTERAFILFYPDSPRVQISDLSDVGGATRFSLDLRRLDMRAVAAGPHPEDVFFAQILRGVVEGTLERSLVDYLTESASGKTSEVANSTSLVFERGQSEGVRTLLLTGDRSALDLKVGDDTDARVREDLSSGALVVAPERQIAMGKEPRFAWWRIDPLSGKTTAVTDQGLQGTEYTLVEDRNTHVVTVTTRTYVGAGNFIRQTLVFRTPLAALSYISGVIRAGVGLAELLEGWGQAR